MHIELRRWADVLLIAPASMDIIWKIATGITDSFALSVIAAWDPRKPVFICPAANTFMINNPRCVRALKDLEECHLIEPVVGKMLACGDVGKGAMASVNEIIEAMERVLKSRSKLGEDSARGRALPALELNHHSDLYLLQESWIAHYKSSWIKRLARRIQVYNGLRSLQNIENAIQVVVNIGCLACLSILCFHGRKWLERR